jgi:hypothetical protein
MSPLPSLVNELVEATDDRQQSRIVAPYGRLDLLCLEELGYVKLDPRDQSCGSRSSPSATGKRAWNWRAGFAASWSESWLGCISLLYLDAESLVECFPGLQDDGMSAAVHRDRELVEEAVLARHDRPGGLPAREEADVSIPL